MLELIREMIHESNLAPEGVGVTDEKIAEFEARVELPDTDSCMANKRIQIRL